MHRGTSGAPLSRVYDGAFRRGDLAWMLLACTAAHGCRDRDIAQDERWILIARGMPMFC
jgi:hypothetical protein